MAMILRGMKASWCQAGLRNPTAALRIRTSDQILHAPLVECWIPFEFALADSGIQAQVGAALSCGQAKQIAGRIAALALNAALRLCRKTLTRLQLV